MKLILIIVQISIKHLKKEKAKIFNRTNVIIFIKFSWDILYRCTAPCSGLPYVSRYAYVYSYGDLLKL